MIVATDQNSRSLIRCIQIGTRWPSRPSCVLGRHCIRPLYYGQTQTHNSSDAKAHLGIDHGLDGGGQYVSLLHAAARTTSHIKVLRDGAWPASSCGHTGVPFAPPTFLAAPPTIEMFGQTPYERATYARSARSFIILTNGAHSSESLR